MLLFRSISHPSHKQITEVEKQRDRTPSSLSRSNISPFSHSSISYFLKGQTGVDLEDSCGVVLQRLFLAEAISHVLFFDEERGILQAYPCLGYHVGVEHGVYFLVPNIIVEDKQFTVQLAVFCDDNRGFFTCKPH